MHWLVFCLQPEATKDRLTYAVVETISEPSGNRGPDLGDTNERSVSPPGPQSEWSWAPGWRLPIPPPPALSGDQAWMPLFMGYQQPHNCQAPPLTGDFQCCVKEAVQRAVQTLLPDARNTTTAPPSASGPTLAPLRATAMSGIVTTQATSTGTTPASSSRPSTSATTQAAGPLVSLPSGVSDKRAGQSQQLARTTLSTCSSLEYLTTS